MKKVKGDLVEAAKNGEVDYVLHGCNCFSTWGAGIALKLKIAFPAAYAADKDDYRSPIEKIGSYSSSRTDDLTIVNLYTQFDIGTGCRKFEYGSFKRALEQFEADFYLGDKTIGVPLIGCGLAGATEHLVLEILEDYAVEGDWTVYYI